MELNNYNFGLKLNKIKQREVLPLEETKNKFKYQYFESYRKQYKDSINKENSLFRKRLLDRYYNVNAVENVTALVKKKKIMHCSLPTIKNSSLASSMYLDRLTLSQMNIYKEMLKHN